MVSCLNTILFSLLEAVVSCLSSIMFSLLEAVVSCLSSVGTCGDQASIFYCEVTDSMKVSAGGGLASEVGISSPTKKDLLSKISLNF